MPTFPNIRYVKDAPVLSNIRIEKSMVSLLYKRGLISENEFPNEYSLIDLEKDIFRRIKDCDLKNVKALEKIFHYIQIWGGKTGRNIYVGREKNHVFSWDGIKPSYEKLVNNCLSVNDNGEQERKVLVKAIQDFKVKYIDIAFITKHVRFWLYKNLGKEKMLPIYDSVMAKGIMGECDVEIYDILPYWKAMVNKAEKEDVSLFALERQLFNYYQIKFKNEHKARKTLFEKIMEQ